MKYNVIDIIDGQMSDDELKKIINKKLYRIIEIMDFSVNDLFLVEE